MGKITTLKPFRFIASVLAVLTLMVSNLQAQVAVTATAGTATGTYTTVSAAFAAINAGTHQGVINITISANTTEPATVVALVNSGFGAASYTDITIKPSGNVTVNSAATPTSNRGLIELNGADNVTIDGDDPATAGDRNLTFQMAVLPAASTTITAVIRLSSNSTTGTNGANNNTVKNCIIIGSRTSATTTTVSYGINMSNYSTTSLLTGAYSSINTVIENNEIRRCHRGVYANGASSLYPNTGLIIRNNIMGSATADLNIGERPIYVACSNTSGVATSALIEGNDVRAGAVSPTGSGYATTLVGIDLGTANSNIRIIRNNIHDIIQPGLTSGAYGIQNGGAASCDNYLIANNFINNIVAAKSTTTLTSTFAACGIRIFAGSTLMRIVNNTIVVNAAQAGTTANYVSHGVVFTATTPTVSQFLNNIVVNNNTGAGTYAIYSASNNIWTTAVVNNNNYYVPNGLIGYYNGSNQATMANWQAAIGQDANSFNVAPNFVSVNDIHITSAATPLESAGAPVSITNVTVDFDNQVRPGPVGSVNGGATNPDIGADEFDATPILAPTVTLGSITPINCTTASSHPVSVTASPGSGTMTSVVLNYAFNGVAQTPISMTNTSGSIYEATIPAATPVNATVTWSVTATNSFSLPITYTGAAYQDQSLLGVTAVANNSLSPVCAGSPSNLSVILSGLAAPNYTLPVVTQALFDEDLGTVVISQGGVDIINNVSVINSLNGTIGTATGTAGSYSNYTAFGPYTLNAGQTYNFSLSSLTTGTAYLNHMRIYIDLNRNGSFADAGECMYVPAANVSGAHTETGSFTIPASAFNGLTRMRVFCYEGAPAAAYINTFGYGEYEDYMINMVSTNSGGGFVPAITSASWSDGTTTLGAGNPYTINPTSTATYTATVTAAGCTVVSSPTTVTALVLPSSVTATNSSQCGSAVPTASVASTAGTSGTGSFYWYSAATGGTTLQSPPLTPIPATSCTYTFNLFDSFGDGWNGATMQVLNGATVVATIGGTFTTGLTATQTVTLQSGTTYTLFWNAAGAYPEEVGVTVLNPAGATIYTMAPVFPNPNVNTTLTTIIADCSTAPPSGFTTGVGYTTFQTAVAATTTFYVSELGTNGCYSTPTPVVVTVSNPDPISFSAGATPSICLGATFNTTASSVNTAYAYSYALSSYTGSGLSAGVTGASVSTTPTTAGVYTFTVTGTDGICTAVTPMPLTVNALPVLTSATATPTTACHNAVVDLAASSIVSGPQTLPSGYCTTNNSGGTGSLMNNVVFGSISNNTAASNPTAAPYYSNYTLTTNVQPGNTYPLSVTISPAGTYTGAIISVWIDYNRDGTLAATEWQQVAVNAPGGTTATINVNVPASAQMGLTKMRIRTRGSGNPNGAGDACSSMGSGETEDYLVNIQSQPAIPYSYTWNSTPVVNTMLGTTVVSNTTAAPTTQTWTVTATEAATGCSNTMTTAPVTIQPAFLAPTTTASTHCGNQVPTASAADPNGFTTPNFNWYAAATLGTALQSSTANTFGSVIGTTTTLYVTTTNPATGCQSDATPVVVTVAAPPALTLSSATLTTCDGVASPTLTVTGPAYDAFSWSPAAGVSGNATAGYTFTASAGTTYTLTASQTTGTLCINNATMALTVNPNPLITSATAGPLSVCNTGTVNLAASSIVSGPQTEPTGYCPSNATSTADEEILNVTFATLNNSSTCTTLAPGPGSLLNRYSNYTTAVAAPNLNIGSTYNLSVEIGTCNGNYSNATKVFIDYNRDGDFADPGENVYTSAAAVAGPHFELGTVTVPATALVGVTRMRVVNVETAPASINACGTYTWGETEDYIVNIQGVPAAVYTYAWNTTPAITGTTGTTVAVNTGANDLTANYVVTATDVATGCFTNMTTNNITVRPTPVVNAGQDVLVCSNNATEQVTLTATGAGPSGTYAWTGPVTGVVNGTPFTVGATGTFVVLGTTQYGCIDTDTLLVTYSTVPPASAGVDQAICFGQTATFAATGLAPYDWTMTNYANSGLAGAVTNSPSITVTPTQPGTYTYQVNVANGVGCTNNDVATLTVYALPVVNAGVDQTICNASPVILAGSGALSYVWNNGVTNATPFFPSATATYTVVGTDINGCQNQDQVIVNVLPQPIVQGGLDQTICAGTPIILNATTTSATPTAVTGFQWSNNVPNNTQYVPTNTGVLTVTATGANGCTNQDQILVTVLALPTVNAGQDFTICAGLSATLNASGAVSYAWNNGVTQGIPFYPNATQTYTVVGTGANGCTNNDQVVVTVSTGPTVNLSTPQTVCANTPATLSAAVQNSLGGFWTTTNGTGVISPNVTNGTVTYTPNTNDPVVVNLTYVATNACGSASQTTTVTVLPIPVVNAGPDFSVCQGNTATLTATGNGFLTWTTPNVTNGVAFTPAATATYNVVATGFNNCTNSDQVTVTVLALPDVNAGADQTICSGESVTLNGEGAVSYQWTGGAANGVAFAPATTATYTVTGTGVNGCENTDQVTVVVNATPVATISVVNDVTLAASPAGMNYQWINCASGTDAPNGSTANFTAIANGSYAVIVTSAEGCSDQSDCEIIDAVGLDQISAIEMSVNPNPTAGELTINMPTELTAKAQVFDAQGKLVIDATNVSNGSVLNLSNMTTGVYMVRISTDASVQTFRVVKQ
jgi:hypothetical protein